MVALSYLVTEDMELIIAVNICRYPSKLAFLRQEIGPVVDTFKHFTVR